MKWDKDHENALELCIRCIEKGQSLATWIAFGIPDKDRPEIIKLANERLSNRESFVFNKPDFPPKEI